MACTTQMDDDKKYCDVHRLEQAENRFAVKGQRFSHRIIIACNVILITELAPHLLLVLVSTGRLGL